MLYTMLTNTHKKRLKRSAYGTPRLLKALELAGITQQTLATDLGFTQSYVSDVGRRRYGDMSLINAYRFAEYFGVMIEDLFPNEKSKPSSTERRKV